MTKNIISTNGKQYTKDQDGNYIVQYRLNFTLNANSNYTLKNYAFFDYLNYSGFANDNKMLPYISYMQDSIELHQIVEAQIRLLILLYIRFNGKQMVRTTKIHMMVIQIASS